MFRKALKFVGLALAEDLNAMADRVAKAEGFAEAVAAEAAKGGDLVIAGDDTTVDGAVFEAGRRLLVPPGVRGTVVRGSFFYGTKTQKSANRVVT